MGRFLKRLFEKELAWIRSRLPFVSRTKKTTARAVDTTPGSPPVAGVPKTGVQTPATRKFPARLSDKSRRATLKKSKSAAHKRLKKPPLISPKREAPLQREIARSPSDPFASVVAAVILHASLLLVIYPLLFPPPEQLPPPKTFVIRWETKKKQVTKEDKPIENPEQPPAPLPEEQPVVEKPPDQETAADPGQDVITDVAGVGAGEGAQGNGRQGEARSQALRHHGGNPNTEDAVRAGLLWLIRHQDRNGSWSPDRFDRHCEEADSSCIGAGYPEHRAGITALALLALLGDGNLPDDKDDPYSIACSRALQWLLDHKDQDGCIRTDIAKGSRNLYDHGIATFALCEAAELTADPFITEAARSAILFLESSQQPGGGWDYTPSPSLRNDLSITGWQVLALHAGIEAGILPEPDTIQSVERYLDRAIDETGHAVYSDRGRGRGRTGFGIDAVGLITRLALGHSPISVESLACAQRISEYPPRPEVRSQWDQHPQSMYYWYTATLALFHVGGSPWKKWNQQLQQQLLPLQIQQGESIGSWDPDPNWIGAAGGRVAQTALGVLTFETYFRYTPLHQRLGIARKPRDR